MADFTSKLPFFTFPDSLVEQEEALASNPLMQRMLAYRHRYDHDPHRPLFHFVNPEGSLNDPNGLCHWQRRWHLFYQGRPPEDPRVHWGHAVSDDLIHWRDLPYAIYPNPEEECYSGTTLVEEDRVIAIYAGTEAGTMIATSRDPLLLNWEKLTGGAVIRKANPDDEPLPFYVGDPCIWKKGDDYYALLAGEQKTGPGQKHRRANYLMRSGDLEHWEYLHPFVEDDYYTLVGDDGSCPYFWPIGTGDQRRHVLLFFSHMSGGQYLIGNYDEERDKLAVSDGGRFNFGPVSFGPEASGGVHAPSAAPNPDGSVTVIFNMTRGMDTENWDQLMTLPRNLRLDENGEFLVTPAGDLASLRGRNKRIGAMKIPANQDTALDGIHGNTMEIEAIIDTKASSMVELDVLCSPDRDEVTRICFFRERGFYNRLYGARHFPDSPSTSSWFMEKRKDSVITLDNTYSSKLAGVRTRGPETAQVFVAEDELLRLRVFIDRSVVEVFVNERQCLAQRVYPGRKDSTGVWLRAQGSEAVLESLDAWQMHSIY